MVGLAILQGHPKLKQIKLGRDIQKESPVELCRKANVMFGPCVLREISGFQGVLSEYHIVVIDFRARNAVIYEGPNRGRKSVLYKNGDHYDGIHPEKCQPSLLNSFSITSVRYFHHSCNDPCNMCLQCLKGRKWNALI